MRKSDFTGWRDVFTFTFSQTVKQKAYGIFLVVFSVIALFYSTFLTLFNQYSEYKEENTKISEVLVFDESGLAIDYTNVFTDKKYKSIPINSNPVKSMEEYEKQMEEEDDNKILIRVTFDREDEKYHMLFVQGKNSGLSEIAKVEFAEEFCDFFEEARMDAVNISKNQRELIQTDIDSEIKTLSSNGEVIDKKKDSISFNDYIVLLILLMVCMMMINISGNQIALSIVTEKSSRVIEYLVINVRPLALIVGKILATIVTSSLQMITVGFCYAASPIISNIITPRISKWMFGLSETSERSTAIADETLANSIKMIHGIKIEFVVLALLFMVLGIIFYGIVAGLLGASVSKMDELQEAMTLFMFMMVVGCYADMALCVMQITEKSSPMLSKLLSICPVTSPFLVPGNMILGNMNWPTIIASFAAMIVVIILAFILTARVYEALIFYNGKPLKIKDIFALASSKKQSGVKEEEKNEK